MDEDRNMQDKKRWEIEAEQSQIYKYDNENYLKFRWLNKKHQQLTKLPCAKYQTLSIYSNNKL